MAHKLFIGGLAFSTSNDRLREVFAEAGEVQSAAVVTDSTVSRGETKFRVVRSGMPLPGTTSLPAAGGSVRRTSGGCSRRTVGMSTRWRG